MANGETQAALTGMPMDLCSCSYHINRSRLGAVCSGVAAPLSALKVEVYTNLFQNFNQSQYSNAFSIRKVHLTQNSHSMPPAPMIVCPTQGNNEKNLNPKNCEPCSECKAHPYWGFTSMFFLWITMQIFWLRHNFENCRVLETAGQGGRGRGLVRKREF